MIVHHIHDIIRYSQKTMTKKYILYIYFKILEQTCGNQSSFCIFKDKKKQTRNKLFTWNDLSVSRFITPTKHHDNLMVSLLL